MAIISDQNLTSFKQCLDDLKIQTNLWTTYLNNAQEQISSNVGITFRTQYAKGKKATENIQTIINTLQSLQKQLNTLINDSNTFYSTAKKASSK